MCRGHLGFLTRCTYDLLSANVNCRKGCIDIILSSRNGELAVPGSNTRRMCHFLVNEYPRRHQSAQFPSACATLTQDGTTSSAGEADHSFLSSEFQPQKKAWDDPCGRRVAPSEHRLLEGGVVMRPTLDLPSNRQSKTFRMGFLSPLTIATPPLLSAMKEALHPSTTSSSHSARFGVTCTPDTRKKTTPRTVKESQLSEIPVLKLTPIHLMR
ncbi:hypothetical protein C8Q74DRAFT_1213842 [Fomes fomentarius]|nr:hypothetical protein C8Q74DRAFT_1213842 [Fomes fomentarius]